MDLIQDNGQPRYGRFQQLPSAISVANYVYQNPYGKTLSGWRKRLKYKKFKFCSIQHAQYSIGLAVVDIAWAGHAFVYIYDHQTQKVQEFNAIHSLAHHTLVDEQPLFNHSHFVRSDFKLDIEHANGVRYIKIKRHGEIVLQARVFCASTAPLSMCSPTGINGWTYTQKLTSLAVEGFFINKQQQKIQFDASSLASLDDTCGFLRTETAWFWLSSNYWDAQHNRIGLNLASGVNESFGNENCLWVNGRLYPLADVVFEREDDQTWQIRSLDQNVQLQVKTGWRRYENLNLRLVGSQFSQWQSHISGWIETEDQGRIEFHQQRGLLEQHYAKW